jgi:predicted TPR repeat methyltransferase
MIFAQLGFGPIPSRASDSHLRRLYEGRARRWTGMRGYRGHELVAEAVAKLRNGGNGLDVLDAGCGSGLLGEKLRKFARRIDGVDISAPMLESARTGGFYDFLLEGDLVEFMVARPASYDLIASAATLIHFGDLTPVFAAAAQALRRNGIFVFTVFPNEHEPESGGFAVAPLGGLAEGGCFVHGRKYIRHVAAAAGSEVVLMDTGVHELDNNGQPVTGLTVALRSK